MSVLHCWAIDGGEHGDASSSSARADELLNSQRLNAQAGARRFVCCKVRLRKTFWRGMEAACLIFPETQ